MNRACAAVTALAALTSTAGAGCPPRSTSSLQATVEAWITAHRNDAVGICVVALDSAGHEGFACGGKADESGRVPDKNTLFQIGSLTKTITSTLLAHKAALGQLSLTGRVDPHMPTEFQMGAANPITFLQLATHHSGLPKDPPNNGDVALMYNDFDECLRAPGGCMGTGYKYSNWGFDVLGDTLAHMDGVPWMDDIYANVLSPLDMNQTATEAGWSETDPDFFADHVATKYKADGTPTNHAPWGMCPIDDPAACLYASSHDMRIWLQYAMGLVTPSGLGDDVRHILRQSYDTTLADEPGVDIGLAWAFDHNQGTLGAWGDACDPLPKADYYYSQTMYTRVGKDGDAGNSFAWIEYLQDPSHPDATSPLGIVVMTNSALPGGSSELVEIGDALLSQLPMP